MADLLYDSGLDNWNDWATGGTFVWLLVQGSYTPDRAHQYISNLTGELSVIQGYSRQDVTGMTRSVDNGLHRITYDCPDPTFGPLQAGVTVEYVVLARKTGSDNTSRLLALYDIASYATDGSVLSPSVSVNGVHYVMQAP